MIRAWLISFAWWLLRATGDISDKAKAAQEVDPVAQDARRAISEANRVNPNASGMWKREQALRMMMNLHPAETEHDLLNAIQAAVGESKRV